MKALRCTPDGICLDLDVPVPVTPPGEVLIQVEMAGICRTDLELSKGYMGFSGILGHEFVGKIDSNAADWPSGTRVVGEINAGCGECSLCREGLERHCAKRTVLGITGRDGCMAEWLTLPARNLLPVPDSISSEFAVLTEPLAAALELYEQIQFQPDHRVCIVGDGKLGLLIAMVIAQKHKGKTLLIGRHLKKMKLLHDRMETVLESELSPDRHRRWDIVVEASGTTQGLNLAMNLVRPRGMIALKSTMAHSEALDLTPLVIDEVTVVGSRCGRFQPALSLLAKGVLPLDRLIEAVYPFDKALEAWNRAAGKGAKKVLLRMID